MGFDFDFDGFGKSAKRDYGDTLDEFDYEYSDDFDFDFDDFDDNDIDYDV